MKSKIILQIHDEILIETVLERKYVIVKLLKECMEESANLSVPLTVEVEEGKSWYQAK